MGSDPFPEEPLSPLDGRYRGLIGGLPRAASEASLHALRVAVEALYLEALVDELSRAGLEQPLTDEERESIRKLPASLTAEDVARIREIEGETRHDVAAVSAFVRERAPERLRRYVHLGLTSEDVNNLAYSAILEALAKGYLAAELAGLAAKLAKIAEREACSPILGRTHGQPAVPTTMGRELGVHAVRIARLAAELARFRPRGKLGGAVGTLAAHRLAFPSIDWRSFSRRFVESLGFEHEEAVKQILPHDAESLLLYTSASACNAAVDLAVDLWLYLMLGYARIRRIGEGEVGSSTMPQKVNPIDVEGGEGLLRMSSRLMEFMAAKLQESRLQRDLSDSAVKRFYGEAFGMAIAGLRRLSQALDRVGYDAEGAGRDLSSHWEVLGEALQVYLRARGMEGAYDLVRREIQGSKLGEEEFKEVLRRLGAPSELAGLRPEGYLGYACEQARDFAREAGELAGEAMKSSGELSRLASALVPAKNF